MNFKNWLLVIAKEKQCDWKWFYLELCTRSGIPRLSELPAKKSAGQHCVKL